MLQMTWNKEEMLIYIHMWDILLQKETCLWSDCRGKKKLKQQLSKSERHECNILSSQMELRPSCIAVQRTSTLTVIIESQNHRMAWVEKDHSDHPVSAPLLCAASPTTRPGCPEPQPGLECLQGWGIHNLLGQPVPVRHHPLCENLPFSI